MSGCKICVPPMFFLPFYTYTCYIILGRNPVDYRFPLHVETQFVTSSPDLNSFSTFPNDGKFPQPSFCFKMADQSSMPNHVASDWSTVKKLSQIQPAPLQVFTAPIYRQRTRDSCEPLNSQAETELIWFCQLYSNGQWIPCLMETNLDAFSFFTGR